MKDALARAEPTDVPRWLITLLVIPLFLFEVGKLSLGMLIQVQVQVIWLLLQAAATPFIGLYILVDIIIVLRWFFARILDKMCGGNK